MRKSFALLLPVLLGTSWLGGCVATPPTEPQVKQLSGDDIGLGTAPAPRAPDAWWRAFGDPQADRLAAQVVSGNPTLQGAMARLRAAEAQLAADQAQDLPQVTLDAQEQRELFSQDFIYPPPYGGSWRWMGSALANLTWTLDFWGKQAALIEKARDKARAAALDADAARLALSGAFAQVYIDLLLAYQEGDIADRMVAERTEILSLTQNRFNSGLENPQSLEQAKALLSLTRAYQLRIAAQREKDVHAIAALMGEGANVYPTIVRPSLNLATAMPLPASLPADLLSRRPDVLAAQARIDAALKGREAAHADFFPNVDLSAFVGFQAVGLSNLIGGNALTLGAGPAIHLPIFDAGKLRAQYADATAELDQAVADYNGAVTGAVKQVADALTDMRSMDAQLAQQHEALASAEKSFAYAETRYKAGLSTQIVLLNAEGTELFIRQQTAALAASEISQRITLMLAVGGGFNPPADATDIASRDKQS